MKLTKSEYYEAHVDPRAYKSFRASGMGRGGSMYSWDGTCDDAKETLTLELPGVSGYPICAYCCRQALPIQKNLRRYDDYRTTGYGCVCKKAMDEVAIREKIEQEEEKHRKKISAIKARGPVINKKAVKLLIDRKTKDIYRDFNEDDGRFFSMSRTLDRAGIKVLGAAGDED